MWTVRQRATSVQMETIPAKRPDASISQRTLGQRRSCFCSRSISFVSSGVNCILATRFSQQELSRRLLGPILMLGSLSVVTEDILNFEPDCLAQRISQSACNIFVLRYRPVCCINELLLEENLRFFEI